MQIIGILILLFGAVLVSVNFKDLKDGTNKLAKGVKETLFAAFMFGVVFWPVNKYVGEHSNWLLTSLLIKFVAISTVLIIAFVRKQNITIHKADMKTKIVIGLVGVLEALAVLSISFGSSIGQVIIVAPIAACLTVVTVTLSVVFLGEKVSKTQVFAILMIISGVVITAI